MGGTSRQAVWCAHSREIDADPPIHLWELASGQEVATLEGHTESTRGLAFSPDGRLLASCSGGNRSSNDQTVRIWDVATGRELRRFDGHLGAVNAVAFTPDGRSVVSGSDDATVLVWDVSDLADHPNAAQPITDEGLTTRWAELAGNDAMRRSPRRLGAERPLGRRVPPRTPATRHGPRPRGCPRGEWADRATRGLADRARHRGTGAGGDARSPRRPRTDGAGKPRRHRDPRREGRSFTPDSARRGSGWSVAKSPLTPDSSLPQERGEPAPFAPRALLRR